MSATAPISIGPTAPPIGVIIRNDDARFVLAPTPRSEMAKIVGNIIDSNK